MLKETLLFLELGAERREDIRFRIEATGDVGGAFRLGVVGVVGVVGLGRPMGKLALLVGGVFNRLERGECERVQRLGESELGGAQSFVGKEGKVLR